MSQDIQRTVDVPLRYWAVCCSFAGLVIGGGVAAQGDFIAHLGGALFGLGLFAGLFAIVHVIDPR